jgi:hypothetical protein
VLLKGCEWIRPSGQVQLCVKANAPGFEQEGELRALRVPTLRGSIWGSRNTATKSAREPAAKKGRVAASEASIGSEASAASSIASASASSSSSSSSAPAARGAKSLLPYDRLLSTKPLGEILTPVMGAEADWFGVEVLIWYTPLAHRDEAGLYLYQDDMNYIKIIIEGARRHYQKPEISVGVQVDGMPQSSPTYFTGRGTKPTEHPFRVRLECCPARRECAGLVWSDVDHAWHVVAVINLEGADGGSDTARVLKSDMDFGRLRPMLVTNTTKIHKMAAGDGMSPLHAEFAQFKVFGGSARSRGEEGRKAVESTLLRIR